jgi:zinc and cadmium transporter
MQMTCIITNTCYYSNRKSFAFTYLNETMFEALIAAALIALTSLIGIFFFGNSKKLTGAQRYVVPLAVGVFLSLVLYELIPETLEASPEWGGLVILLGFLGFYILAHKLHQRYHHLEADDCDRKGAASLILVGDSIHNFADGIILGGAFMIDPVVGFATAIGLALHEAPMEIVEYGVLIRAGYSRRRALSLNLLTASTIILGVLVVYVLSEVAQSAVWVLFGLAAGNLLFLAASDLLPRIHGNLKHYGSIWQTAFSILLGFAVMTLLVTWSHDQFGHAEHGHDEIHEKEDHENELHDEDEEEHHDEDEHDELAG